MPKTYSPTELREHAKRMHASFYEEGVASTNFIFATGLGAGMLEVVADQLERVPALEAALREAAGRLKRAAIAGGTDEEYATLAVAKYMLLLGDKPSRVISQGDDHVG